MADTSNVDFDLSSVRSRTGRLPIGDLSRHRLITYKGCLVRDQSGDYGICDQIYSGEYRNMKPAPGDSILDMGANFGVFTRWAAENGANVLSVEPEPNNFALLEINTLGFENVSTVQAAITRELVDEVPFYLSTRKNPAAHRSRGGNQDSMWVEITVPAVPLSGLLETYRPNKIKCDVEGAEYDLFMELELPPYVKHLSIEMHRQRNEDVASCKALHKHLAAQFPYMHGERSVNNNWFIAVVEYSKEPL